MLEHYKKTFCGVQALMASIGYEVWINTHSATSLAVFVVVMQLASVAGARWAVRLKRKIEASALPG